MNTHMHTHMHFTTRCPACGTMFRVADDQLKISDGWVRCGHCADVFDAKLYLQNWQPPATSDPDAGTTPFQVPAAGTSEQPRPTALPRWVADSQQSRAHTAETPHNRVPTTRLTTNATASTTANTATPSTPMPLSSRWGTADTEASPIPWWQSLRRQATEGLGQTDAGGDEPSFVRQARRRAFWHAPGMRVRLSALAFGLTALLGLQWVLHQRDHIAARQPQWTPALQRLCAPLGCEVSALRRIDAIVIDSSTLLLRADKQYAFDVVLKNTASVPLALPALELSLTDSRDAVLARRVFLPHELPDAPAQLPANSTITLRLSLALAVGEAMPMAGYRALVFYP